MKNYNGWNDNKTNVHGVGGDQPISNLQTTSTMKESTQAAKEYAKVIELAAENFANDKVGEVTSLPSISDQCDWSEVKEAFIAGAKWASPSPPQKSKEEITEIKNEILYRHVGKLAVAGIKWKSLEVRKKLLHDAMEEYASSFANQFTQPPSDNEKVNKDENNY